MKTKKECDICNQLSKVQFRVKSINYSKWIFCCKRCWNIVSKEDKYTYGGTRKSSFKKIKIKLHKRLDKYLPVTSNKIDWCTSKIKINKHLYYIAYFYKEILIKYNLIKSFLSDETKFKGSTEAIKQDISYKPFEIKKSLKGTYFFYREKRIKMVSEWLVFYNLKKILKI